MNRQDKHTHTNTTRIRPRASERASGRAEGGGGVTTDRPYLLPDDGVVRGEPEERAEVAQLLRQEEVLNRVAAASPSAAMAVPAQPLCAPGQRAATGWWKVRARARACACMLALAFTRACLRISRKSVGPSSTTSVKNTRPVAARTALRRLHLASAACCVVQLLYIPSGAQRRSMRNAHRVRACGAAVERCGRARQSGGRPAGGSMAARPVAAVAARAATAGCRW
jgi:hypothetical protein